MELHQLAAALTGCLSLDASIRKAAEQALSQHQHAPGQIVNLLRVALEDAVDPAIRQVAAISFKNTVKKEWEDREGRLSPLAQADKAAVRDQLVDCIVRASLGVRVQLEEAAGAMVSADFPEHWPALLVQLRRHLQTGDLALVGGALRMLRLLARKFEFKDEDARDPLGAIVEGTFPLLLPLFQSLVANPSASPDLADLIKLCCKVFWSACYLEIPPLLLREDQFVGWMLALHALLQRQLPLESLPADADARQAWPWFKAKKWALNIACRLFNRYGDPKLCGARTTDAAFAVRWAADCCQPFLEAVLRQLAAVTGPNAALGAPRVVNLLLSYVTEAVGHKGTWRALKPHVPAIVTGVIFPLLAFSEDDEELWEDDPQEFVRKGYDVIEDLYSTKTAAMQLLQQLCRARRKSQLDPAMAHLVGTLKEYAAAVAGGGAPPQGLARRMDGALLAIGALEDVLKKEPRYRGQLEPMLTAHIIPLFASACGHLRAKAAWLAGVYAEIEFVEGAGRGAAFTALLERVISALNDPELPVRVDAAVAVRHFIDAIEAEDLGPLRPLVPQLLQRFLTISQETDAEDLTYALESVVERFGADMAPYAAGVMQALAAQFWRQAEADNDGEEGGGEDVDEFRSGPLAGYSVLRAMSTVLDSVSSLPQLYPQLEELLYPILERYTSADGMDVFEEITGIITYLTYFAPAVTPRMWSLYPRLLSCLDDWAIHYFEDILLPLDNYISRGTEEFLTCQDPPYLALTNRSLEKALASEELEEGQAACAPKLMSVVLQHCRGRVDNCVPPFLALVMRRLAANPGDQELRDALLLVGADALYYNAPLTLGTLSSAGALSQFMGALSAAVAVRSRSGRMRHFLTQREKKVCALGLTAVLAAPAAALRDVPGVAESQGQVASAVVALLQALRQQEEAAARAAAAEGSEAASDSDDSGSDGGDGGSDGDDDESEPEDTQLRRLQRQAARRHAEDNPDSGSDVDWYSDEEDAEVSSPIDAVSPFVFFADVLQAAQASDPSRLSALVIHMDSTTQAAVQALIEHAAVVRQTALAAAAAGNGALGSAPA